MSELHDAAIQAIDDLHSSLAYSVYCTIRDGLDEIPTLKERDKDLEDLWHQFEDVPMNPETECLETSFLGFPEGTHREEIWHWFDEHHSRGVYWLLYGDKADDLTSTQKHPFSPAYEASKPHTREKKYILSLDEEQANLLSHACDFYARMRMGQWQELVSECLEFNTNDFCEQRDRMEQLLLEVRAEAMPELMACFSHSYGVGKFHDADLVWEIYEVLRNRIAWTNNPKGGDTVDFGDPMSFSGHSLAECKVEYQE